MDYGICRDINKRAEAVGRVTERPLCARDRLPAPTARQPRDARHGDGLTRGGAPRQFKTQEKFPTRPLDPSSGCTQNFCPRAAATLQLKPPTSSSARRFS